MKSTRFVAFAWAVLGYNLLVILWGAAVRATGSGAGCGDHWPLCNGVVVPHKPQIQTLIELSHRLSSGIALLLVVALIWAARKTFPAAHASSSGHRARKATYAAGAFMLLEALIGAGIVLFKLVAHNDSLARAFSMSLHLVNTFLLLGALALSAWWGAGRSAVSLRGHGARSALFLASLGGICLVGITGAVAALGDTLFPRESIPLAHALDSALHVLLRLRIFHPFVAVGVACLLLGMAWYYSARHASEVTKNCAIVVFSLVFAQLVLGVVNVVLMAPLWMQMVHLGVANMVWVAQVLFTASALSSDALSSDALSSDALGEVEDAKPFSPAPSLASQK